MQIERSKWEKFLKKYKICCTIIRDFKSLHRSLAVRDFYGRENEIWAGFGLVCNTEKKIEAYYEQLLRAVLSCFQKQIYF
jgi:hypothetical protein